MKNSLLLFSVLFILCFELAEAQPSLPDSSHVLVVYKLPDPNNPADTISQSIKNYYQQRRGIPSTNIVGLDSLFNEWITDPETQDSHYIKLEQQGETISDINNTNTWCATKHAWIYFNEKIAKPIANHLNNTYVNGTPLKDIIRFIVLCKGIPFKIHSRTDDGGYSKNKNVVVDRLLCLLGETIKNPDALLDYFYSAPDPNCDVAGYELNNPYYNSDLNFTTEHNFVPNYYTTTVTIGGQNRTVTLSYLVTHLSAPRYEDIAAMIDRSILAINPQDYDWFIDAHPYPIHGGDYLIRQANSTEYIFDLLGIENYYFDRTDSNITEHNKPIMTYSSHGVHQYWPSDYIQSKLNFTYADGSIFNTAESFNGYSIGTWPIIRRPVDLHGLVAEYMLVGGTVGVAHSYEPSTTSIVRDDIMFPMYALGFTFIEAAYSGMPSLRGDNVVVGDPLTRIAYPCRPLVLTENTTISSGNYDCGIVVPEGITLTVAFSSVVNFTHNAILMVKGTLNLESNARINFDDYSEFVTEGSAVFTAQQNTQLYFGNYSLFKINSNFDFNGQTQFYFNGNSKMVINGSAEIFGTFNLNLLGASGCKVNGSLTLAPNAYLILNGSNSNNFNNYGTLHLSSGSVFNINNTSKFYSYGKVYLDEGVIVNQNNSTASSFYNYGGVFKSLGSVNNRITINLPSVPSASSLGFSGMDSVMFSHTTINNGYINFSIGGGIQKPRLISMANSIINNSLWGNGFSVNNTEGVDAIFSDNEIYCNSTNGDGMSFSGFDYVQLVRNNIHNIGSSSLGEGINIRENKSVEINDCDIINFGNGIVQGRIGYEEAESINNQDIRIYKCTLQGTGYNQGTGISLGYDLNNSVTAAKIDLNNIMGFSSCIAINNPNYFPIQIKNNLVTNFGLFGISLSGGNDAVIKENYISTNVPSAENCVGIYLGLSSDPKILSNTISAEGVTIPGAGICSVSSGGEIRNNTIQHHWYGIELGSSSPNIGANTITDNLRYGIYINDHSYPDLSEQIVGGDPYPLSGYNTIRENGECNFFPSYSELYLRFNSTVNLEKGCNTIADDREDPALHCNYLYLIDGNHVVRKVNAIRNYWGEVNHHNPEGRFGGGLIVDYADWQIEPCTYDEGGGILILANSKGEVYDTIYSSGETPSELTEIESRYAAANEYYYNNQYTQAKQEYASIIEEYGDSTESLQAYNRLFTIANLTNSPPASFAQLKDFYSQNVSNQTDSIMIGTLTHLSDLCLVSAEEYITAINKFDEIAQQNPNTDIALYRQIDALTTSLLMPQDSSLNKGVLGKYSVSDLSEYNNKLSELLKTRGKSGLETGEELLPTEFTLYQNYPNPFNPVTTIKYDLPDVSDVSLIIYDILGRKVKELVNTKQQAGRYEVQFNASTLASGVYIYQLIAENPSTSSRQGYINSKKMILLK